MKSRYMLCPACPQMFMLKNKVKFQESYLDLSGIQSFCSCKRQWALSQLEGQWKKNPQITDLYSPGQNAQKKSDCEERGGVLVAREMHVFSSTLRVMGICDVVEFHKFPKGISLTGQEGLWLPVPVKYKRDKTKETDADRLQLCGQAMCLEEMLLCRSIPKAYLYYGNPMRRVQVTLTEELRSLVCSMTGEMHDLIARKYMPRGKEGKICHCCSFRNVCFSNITPIANRCET